MTRLMSRAVLLRIVRIASVLTVLGAWELWVDLGWVNSFVLPALSDVLKRGWVELIDGDLAYQSMLTIYRTLVGFLITAVLGVSIGAIMARYAFARWFFDPIVSVGFPMPKVSLIPIFILWFGVYEQPKLIMIVIGSIFPVISATFLATSTIDRYLVWSARNLGTGEQRMLWKVVVPAALPQILSGLQIAFPLALILAVVSEMLTTGGGLGNYMILAARFADSQKVFVGILAIGILGYATTSGLLHLRRWLLRWHSETHVTQ
jgi:ABC-type nitrate/sulfonate/bicarbonate transport system permease component